MPTKRSNKTARVLNLIATPSEATTTEQVSAPDADMKKQPDPVVKQHKEKVRSSNSKSKQTPKVTSEVPSTTAATSSHSSEKANSPAEDQTQLETTSFSPPPTPQPVVPILQNVREKEQQLSDDIRSGLLQALDEAEASASPDIDHMQQATTEAEPSEAISSEIDPYATQNTEVLPKAQDKQDVPHPSLSSPPNTEISSPQSPISPPKKASTNEIYTPTGEQDVVYTNVLQELVEEIAPYYIDHMLQCHCQRCIVDMKALALTNLPSKYVVLEKSKRNAFMSVYAARYDKLLSVQMMRACVIVNDHPHH